MTINIHRRGGGERNHDTRAVKTSSHLKTSAAAAAAAEHLAGRQTSKSSFKKKERKRYKSIKERKKGAPSSCPSFDNDTVAQGPLLAGAGAVCSLPTIPPQRMMPPFKFSCSSSYWSFW